MKLSIFASSLSFLLWIALGQGNRLEAAAADDGPPDQGAGRRASDFELAGV